MTEYLRRAVGRNSEAYCADLAKTGGFRHRLNPAYALVASFGGEAEMREQVAALGLSGVRANALLERAPTK